jgi:2-iminobutanoate/2-iminopropanoate deaminase
MEKHISPTEAAPAPIGPYSQAVMVNGTLYMSGQIPINPSTNEVLSGTIEAETALVMQNIGGILKAYHLDYTHIVKTTIFLKSMDDFAKVNAVYGTYFKDDYPARETVQVSRLPKDVNVEISCIAVR